MIRAPHRAHALRARLAVPPELAHTAGGVVVAKLAAAATRAVVFAPPTRACRSGESRKAVAGAVDAGAVCAALLEARGLVARRALPPDCAVALTGRRVARALAAGAVVRTRDEVAALAAPARRAGAATCARVALATPGRGAAVAWARAAAAVICCGRCGGVAWAKAEAACALAGVAAAISAAVVGATANAAIRALKARLAHAGAMIAGAMAAAAVDTTLNHPVRR